MLKPCNPIAHAPVVLWRDKIEEGAPDDPICCFGPEEPDGGRIGIPEVFLDSDQDGLGAQVGKRVVAFLAPPHLLFRLFALGNVFDGEENHLQTIDGPGIEQHSTGAEAFERMLNLEIVEKIVELHVVAIDKDNRK